MESWIASGGEPNVARRLPELLTNAGFRVSRSCRVCARFRDAITPGNGPRASSKSTSPGYKSSAAFHRRWAADVLREFREAEADPNAWFTTPMFLEIVAQKR